MALPTPDQAIPRAIVRERIPATPAAGSPAELARRINEQADQGNWRAAFERSKMPQVERGKVEQVREQIGVERDVVTGAKVRNPQEQARYDRLGNAAALVTKFLEQGYDGLTPVEQGNLRGKVLDEASLRPAIRAQLTGLTVPELQAFAARLLRDPKMAAKAREFLTQISDPEHKLADEVTPSKQQFGVAELERNAKQEDVDDVDRRLNPINAQLVEFARPGGGVGPGARALEMDTLRGETETPVFQTELGTKRQELETAQRRLQDLRDERTRTVQYGIAGGRRPLIDIDPDIGTAETAVRNAKNEVDTRETKINRLEQLKLREQQLNQQKHELEREKAGKNLELGKAKLEFDKRQQELRDAETLRASHEEDLVQGFENVFAQATNDLLMDQVDAAATKFDTEIETLKAQTADQQKKAMYDAIANAWRGRQQTRYRGGVFGIGARPETYRPIDRTLVNGDFNTLMTPGEGPENVMVRLLTTQRNPTATPPRNYTAAEARDIISNKEYRNEMQPLVVKQLLANRVLTGGLSQEDISYITDSDWGQEMIQKALEHNAEFRSNVDKVLGAGALSGRGFRARLGQEFRRHPWWFMLLLGIPFGIIGASRMVQSEADIAQ